MSDAVIQASDHELITSVIFSSVHVYVCAYAFGSGTFLFADLSTHHVDFMLGEGLLVAHWDVREDVGMSVLVFYQFSPQSISLLAATAIP